jgi:hypothetical protein
MFYPYLTTRANAVFTQEMILSPLLPCKNRIILRTLFNYEQNIDEVGAEINPRPVKDRKFLDMGNNIFNQTRAVIDKARINLN